MPLTVSFDIDELNIGKLTITRKEDGGEKAHYQYEYRGHVGFTSGWVWHRPADGAMTLVARVMEQIDFPNWKLV